VLLYSVSIRKNHREVSDGNVSKFKNTKKTTKYLIILSFNSLIVMRLIVNTSNLYKGGGVQVGYSFINECVTFSENEYHIFLCKILMEQIDKSKFPSNFYFYDIPKRPSPFFRAWSVVSNLKELEKEIQPDCVFSIFGPSYWSPQAPHLLGYAIPHFLYPESPFFKNIGVLSKTKLNLMKMVKKHFLLKNAKYFHVETEDSRIRLSKFLKCPIDNIYSVSNTYNSIYNRKENFTDNLLLPAKFENEFRFITISAYYPHKNLDILNEVVVHLKEIGLTNIRFVLTISRDVYESTFSLEAKSQIINIGPVSITKCPQLYSECDVMFLPTLLECFSANYPEAMKMGIPILTSDLSFAHEVCKDAALYFNPLNPTDIVSKIKQIVDDKDLRSQLVSKGTNQLKNFCTSNERAKQYLKLCEQIIKN